LRLLVVLISGVPVLKTLANGFQLPDQDAFATARGEAFVATADNPSAIYYNPAGITQLAGDNLRGGIYGIYLDPTFNPPATAPNSGQTYGVGKHFAAVPDLFYTHTLTNLPLSFGLGIYAPFGGSIDWPDDTGFRTVATKGSLTYLRVNPVVAWKICEQFSIAAGMTVDYAKIDLEQGLRPLPEPLMNYFRFEGDGYGVGYNAGLLWQPDKEFSVGVTLRGSTSIKFDGQTEFEQQPVIAAQSIPASAGFTFPLTAAAGFSYRPTPKWNLEIDADYTDWSSFGTVTIHQQNPPPFPIQQNIPATLDWEASWMCGFGVTRYIDDDWHVSAGYLFNENSVPNAYYTPLAADLDRHFFSLGTGRKGKRFDFDIAYQFGYGPGHTVSGSTPSSSPGQFAGQTADGTYHFLSQAVLVTAGVRF
jgi:long-chain fatty acid transport protein